MVDTFEDRVEENLGEGQPAWEKDNSKKYAISKSITTFEKKNANIERIDFMVRGKYEIAKKNKDEISKDKKKVEEYKDVILVVIVLTRESLS